MAKPVKIKNEGAALAPVRNEVADPWLDHPPLQALRDGMDGHVQDAWRKVDAGVLEPVGVSASRARASPRD